MQHKNDFLLDTCFWLISAIIIYLIYPMIYCIIWAMRARDYIDVTKYEGINRGIAQTNYASLAGMLVATVKWGALSIKNNSTSFALEILDEAMKDRKKVDDVVERYNRRFNVKHKEV